MNLYIKKEIIYSNKINKLFIFDISLYNNLNNNDNKIIYVKSKEMINYF